MKAFICSLRARYSETDQMGIVYHANYLPWLELGRTEALRQIGISYKEMEQRGIFVPVLDLNIHYKSPAFYDDRIAVVARIGELSKATVTFSYEVRRLNGGELPQFVDAEAETTDLLRRSDLLATAESRHAWVDRNRKPLRLDRTDPDVHALLLKYTR